MTPDIMYDILIFETSDFFRKIGEKIFISGRGSIGFDPTLSITTV